MYVLSLSLLLISFGSFEINFKHTAQHLLSHVSLEDLPGHLPQLDGCLLLDQAHRPLLHQPLRVALLLEDNVAKLHRLECLPVLGEVLEEKVLF